MINLSSTPAAPAGASNVVWQSDVSGNVSAYVSLGGIVPAVATPVAGVLVLDATVANSFTVTLTANVTSSSVTPGPNGEQITIMWIQNVTGGWTVVMPTNFKGATAPSAGANTHSLQRFSYNAADSNWYAVAAGITGL